MGGKSRYVWAVWALLIGFSLFRGGWFLFQARISGPYRVTTARYPPRVGPSGVQSAPTDSSVLAHHSHPDSLLPGETIDLNTADWYDLQRLPGIGEKRRNALLKQFKSIKAIKAASLAQLQEAAGKVTGKVIYDYFNPPPSGTR